MSFSESIHSSASQIGGVEDAIERDRLMATCEAFNAIAQSATIRQNIQQSLESKPESVPYCYGPYVFPGSISVWRIAVNSARRFHANRLEEKGWQMLPPDESSY